MQLLAVKRPIDPTIGGVGARLSRCTSNAMEAAPLVGRMFNQLYEAGREYRSTTVVLNRLESDRQQQYDLNA